jgi:hypothetical protein
MNSWKSSSFPLCGVAVIRRKCLCGAVFSKSQTRSADATPTNTSLWAADPRIFRPRKFRYLRAVAEMGFWATSRCAEIHNARFIRGIEAPLFQMFHAFERNLLILAAANFPQADLN